QMEREPPAPEHRRGQMAEPAVARENVDEKRRVRCRRSLPPAARVQALAQPDPPAPAQVTAVEAVTGGVAQPHRGRGRVGSHPSRVGEGRRRSPSTAESVDSTPRWPRVGTALSGFIEWRVLAARNY